MRKIRTFHNDKSYFKKASSQHLRGLLHSQTKRGGYRVLNRTELSSLKAEVKRRNLKPIRRNTPLSFGGW